MTWFDRLFWIWSRKHKIESQNRPRKWEKAGLYQGMNKPSYRKPCRIWCFLVNTITDCFMEIRIYALIWSIALASWWSFSVMASSWSCVQRVIFTLLYSFDQSGWWFAHSATRATLVIKAKASEKSLNLKVCSSFPLISFHMIKWFWGLNNLSMDASNMLPMNAIPIDPLKIRRNK